MKKLISYFTLFFFLLITYSHGMQLLKEGVELLGKRIFFTPVFHFSKNPILENTFVDPIIDSAFKGQVFCQPTYDKFAKYLLKEDEGFRIYVLETLSGVPNIEKADLLDEHLNPFDKYSTLRKLVKTKEFFSYFDEVRKNSKKHDPILVELANHYSDIKSVFPSLQDYNSQVDFLCETSFGYFTIELQLAKDPYWDARALAYVALAYGNQLRKGQKWQDIKKIIGINIIGDGSVPYCRDEFYRDYMFQDQETSMIINFMRLKQYFLGDFYPNHPKATGNKSLIDVLSFFKEAHKCKEIPEGIDERLKEGYKLSRVDKMKKEQPDLIKDMIQFGDLSEHNEAVRNQEKIKMVRRMLQKNVDINTIIEVSGLLKEEIEKLE
ncbi:MAG: PD-(D/E)XK nuclease family transposase [Alphaproteobacteria bacterium]